MKLTFLGTGSAFCRTLYQTNLLLELNGSNLLIDCGSTAVKSIVDTGRSPQDIQNIFITHLHGDHIGGLEQVALSAKYFWSIKPNLFIAESLVGPLWNYSLRGGLEYTDVGTANLDFYFNVIPVNQSFFLEGIEFHLIPTEHVWGMLNYGLLFDKIYYSGDAKFSPGRILRYGSDAGTVFHDCDHIPNPVHTHIDEMLTLPRDIREKTLLVHYSDGFEGLEKKAGPGGFRLAVQQHSYELSDGHLI